MWITHMTRLVEDIHASVPDHMDVDEEDEELEDEESTE